MTWSEDQNKNLAINEQFLHMYFGHTELYALWLLFLQLLVTNIWICKSQGITVELWLDDWTTLKKQEKK